MDENYTLTYGLAGMVMSNNAFPDGFVWGAATSAYQVEGAVNEDGRGESIWDRFARVPGRIANGDTGEQACDHYHRWPEDIELMKELGLGAYRFSIAWPRILPKGWGAASSVGLDFYDRLTDGLLDAGIEPWVTLYHWDLPARLETMGGWAGRDTPKALAEFAEVVTRRYGDRVKKWITVNEPWVISVLGYGWGIHAPGERNWGSVAAAAHHVMLGHGWSVPVIREQVPNARVGIALNPTTILAGSDLERDFEAAIREDGLRNRMWLDPLAGRGYPDDMIELFGNMMPEIEPGDLKAIAQPTDFLAVNYYSPGYVADSPETLPLRTRPVARPELESTAMGWHVQPGALTELLVRLHTDYHFGPIYVTENGAAFEDPTPEDGVVHDPRRLRYLHDHLVAVLDALASGVPVEGYFAWSLMDNFEWAEGYAKRFGIVHVDFETQKRTIKQSGRWYSNVIDRNELVDPL
ncbi:GH1 family beta-glucosidase [soil metagenome]